MIQSEFILTTTGQKIFPLNEVTTQHVRVLIPFGCISKKGNRGHIHIVKKTKVKQQIIIGEL